MIWEEFFFFLQQSDGLSRGSEQNKIEKNVFFFNFQKNGSRGSVKREIKNSGLRGFLFTFRVKHVIWVLKRTVSLRWCF